MKPLSARIDNRFRRLLRCLCEDVEDHNRITIDAVNNAPRFRLVLYAQFVARPTDRRHGARMGQRDVFATLQATQKHAGLNTCSRRKRRRLNLAMQPDQRFVSRRHGSDFMSLLTYRQSAPGCATKGGCAGAARRTEGAELAHRGRPERENHDGPVRRSARL